MLGHLRVPATLEDSRAVTLAVLFGCAFFIFSLAGGWEFLKPSPKQKGKRRTVGI